ncbi:MAG TPA: TonB family protein [Longimicrobium sp.]|nr:TonB family protein [Longimicrobium sp.]
MSTNEPLLVGRLIGARYRLKYLIGRGGMGAVYAAVDERMERPVAVKVVSLAGAGGDVAGARASFTRSATMAAALRHPNVVAMLDAGSDAELGAEFVAMELLEGLDLSRRLAHTGALPGGEVTQVLRDAAAGLGAAHRAGLVHGNVTPASLFLTEQGSTRVLDLGFARLEGWADPRPAGFASPEQARGETPTPASDVYALGLAALALLLGNVPGSPAVALERLRRWDDRAAAALVPVLGQMLRADPAERLSDGDAVHAALQMAASGAPRVVEHPHGPARRERPAGTARRPHPKVLKIFASLAVAAIGAAIVNGPFRSAPALGHRATDDRDTVAGDTPPVQITPSPFQYPDELWDAQVEGQTTLRIFISVAGTVDTARIEHSSGYPAFDSVAVHGAREIRFRPATVNGVAVDDWVLLPVKFELSP